MFLERAAEDRFVRAEIFSELNTIGTKISGDDDCTLQAGELRNELADEAETDDDDMFAQADVGDADSVEGDAADGGERGVVESYVIWNARD